jgi:hypothetical protein
MRDNMGFTYIKLRVYSSDLTKREEEEVLVDSGWIVGRYLLQYHVPP